MVVFGFVQGVKKEKEKKKSRFKVFCVQNSYFQIVYLLFILVICNSC